MHVSLSGSAELRNVSWKPEKINLPGPSGNLYIPTKFDNGTYLPPTLLIS